jgi:tetratricopeptide (TPR) repeat protein
MADLKDSLGIVATALGLAGTIWGYWKFVWSKKKARDQLKAHLAVGDRIAASAELEGEGYEQALERYEMALALDPGNVDIVRRVARTVRRKLELENPVSFVDGPARKEVDAILARLYELRIDHDRELLLEEAALLDLAGKRDSAVAALAKVRERHPEDPEVLARIGLLTLDAELLERAIAARPGDAAHHHALAYVFDKRGEHAAAVREYRRAAELATGPDIASRRTRTGALQDILQVFKQRGTQLGLPPEVGVEALEALVASRVSLDRTQHFLLASLYLELGRLDKARAAVRTGLGEDKTSWRYYLPQLRLYETILERGGFDAATLAEVKAILQQAAEAELYEETLEIGEGEQHRKVGLRIEKRSPGSGVLVQRCFAGYPFAKAGVRNGDRIVELGHRRIQHLRDIWQRLMEFKPGADLPLKVQRAEELVELTVIVQ